MYRYPVVKYADGHHTGELNVNIQRSVRLDRYTNDVIDNSPGVGFSDKLREYVRVMELVRNHPDFMRLYNESTS